MTISIPPFANVPDPGSPIASAWAQQLTQFAVDLPRGIVARSTTTGITPAAAETQIPISPSPLVFQFLSGRRYRVVYHVTGGIRGTAQVPYNLKDGNAGGATVFTMWFSGSSGWTTPYMAVPHDGDNATRSLTLWCTPNATGVTIGTGSLYIEDWGKV